MEQPVPTVTAEDVERVILRDYDGGEGAEVRQILAQCGSTPRVHLAVLKVADRDIAMLQQNVRVAKMDYRDVLAAAEYPRYTREIAFHDASNDLRLEVIEEDWIQYRDWLSAANDASSPTATPSNPAAKQK